MSVAVQSYTPFLQSRRNQRIANKTVNAYDQEMPQSQTAIHNTMSTASHNTIKGDGNPGDYLYERS